MERIFEGARHLGKKFIENQIERGKEAEVLKPKLAWLTVNHRCNLHCEWCYQKELGGKGKTMPKELAKELVDLLAAFNMDFLVLIGGEPSLWEHFFTLVKYIREKGMKVTVVSNALAFSNQKFLEKTVRAGVTNITVSVKGTSSAEYQETAGNAGGYDVVCRAIRNIQKTPIIQMISVTVSYSTIQNWSAMMEFLKGCGAKFFSFSFEKPVVLSDGRITFDDRMMPDKVAPFIHEVMYPSLVEAGIDFKMEFIFPHCHYSQEFIDGVEKANHAFGGCLLLRSNGVVFDPEGFVLPCNHFIGYPLGKYGVDFKTPDEFLRWRSEPKISGFYENTMKSPCGECTECERWGKCGSGCRLFWLYRGPKELIKKYSR